MGSLEKWWGGTRTLELLEHALDGARAAAARHADVEDVVVLGDSVGSGGGGTGVGHCV